MKRRDFLKIATGSAGGAAAIGVAGARSPSGSAAVQEGEENNTTSGNGSDNGTETDGGEGGLPGAGTTEEVAVGPGGQNIFDPENVYVQAGTTVKWVWESGGHNVAPEAIPDGTEWEGHNPLESAGFEYEHTFETEGTYDYVCTPHASLGMVGSIVVNESGQAPSDEAGGGEGLHPEEMGVPFQAHFVGIATILMMIVSLVYAFFVLKYGESQHASAPNKE